MKYIILFMLSLLAYKIKAQSRELINLSKEDIKKIGVKKIELKKCASFFDLDGLDETFEPDSDKCPAWVNFYFKNGRLEYFEGEQMRPVEYTYDSPTGFNISNRNVNVKGVYCAGYIYKKWLHSINYYTCNPPDNGNSSEITYHYDDAGKLLYAWITYEENPKHPMEVKYFYDHDKLKGFYPARYPRGGPFKNAADTIYSSVKINEFAQTGFQKFAEKNLSQPVMNKLIEDSYAPVKATQVMIDSLDLKQFLKKINKGDAKYIVLEVADNYFLFYKLID